MVINNGQLVQKYPEGAEKSALNSSISFLFLCNLLPCSPSDSGLDVLWKQAMFTQRTATHTVWLADYTLLYTLFDKQSKSVPNEQKYYFRLMNDMRIPLHLFLWSIWMTQTPEGGFLTQKWDLAWKLECSACNLESWLGATFIWEKSWLGLGWHSFERVLFHSLPKLHFSGKKRLSPDKRKIMQEELDTVNLLY